MSPPLFPRGRRWRSIPRLDRQRGVVAGSRIAGRSPGPQGPSRRFCTAVCCCQSAGEQTPARASPRGPCDLNHRHAGPSRPVAQRTAASPNPVTKVPGIAMSTLRGGPALATQHSPGGHRRSACRRWEDLKDPQSHHTGAGPYPDLHHSPDSLGSDEAGQDLAPGNLAIVTE
jgi:hypothetical protein